MSSATLDFLQAHQSEMVDDLRQFVESESPSRDADRLSAFAEFLASYAQGMGGVTEVIEALGGNRHVRVEWGSTEEFAGGERQPPVLLLGHFDTVWPVGTVETMPFRVDGGVARGPGIFDMKAGLVQGFWAVRALREIVGADRRIVFLCTSDEEIGSGTSRDLIEAEARQAAAVLVLEPSHEGALKTARKGVGNFWVTVTGRAAHAGLEPGAGISAIEELAHLILKLHSLSEPAAGSTVNVGVISGGTRSNVVAAEATAEVDVRFASQDECDRLTDAILHVQPHRGDVQVQVTGGPNRPSMERTAQTAALFARAQDIAAELGFSVGEIAVGGGSDGNFCAPVGAAVLDGLGAVGGGAHGLDEHVIVDAMPLRAALVSELLAAL